MSGQMTESSDAAESTADVPETPRGKKALAWQHFEPQLVLVNNVPMAVCKHCGLKMKAARNSGTSSLRNHIVKSCPKIEDAERQRFMKAIEKKESAVGFVFSPERTRALIGKFCIHGEIPFNKFEDPYFEELMESMQPTFAVHGWHNIRDDCVRQYEDMKKELRKELESLESRICLTSDMWTSVQKKGYMCIIAHYIDANFKLQKKIISFKVVKYPHTGLAIEEALSMSIADWGIKRKLFTITLDNAANNTLAVEEFLKNQDHGLLLGGIDFHMRCSAHILNLLDLTEAEWAVLKAFEEASKLVSADRKPAVHLFLNMVLGIRNALRDTRWQTDDFLKSLAVSMSKKFIKYWEEASLNMALMIAAVLDPTQKMDYVEFFYVRSCEDQEVIEDNVTLVKETMKLYFRKYAEHVKRNGEKSLPRESESLLSSPMLGKRKLDEEFAQYKARRRASRVPDSELDAYLDEPSLPSVKDFDVLEFWKQNSVKYPVLSAMARDFLAIPLSMVSSESAFSCAGRILGDTGTSLNPETLEALVCAKDWLIKEKDPNYTV